MLRPRVTQEWVDEGEMPRERTKNQRWQRPYDVLAEATRMIEATGELDCFSAHICLREPGKSEDKAEGGSTDREGRDADASQRIVGLWLGSTMVPQRRDFRGVIDPLLSWRESIGRKRGRGGGGVQRPRNFIRPMS
ncbi:hypothetical protein BHE74_00057978, partial [Ensete ventricosum]